MSYSSALQHHFIMAFPHKFYVHNAFLNTILKKFSIKKFNIIIGSQGLDAPMVFFSIIFFQSKKTWNSSFLCLIK